MCLGSVVLLAEAWDDAGVRLGRLEDGCVVPLSFVPAAEPGVHLLIHLGFPVEVLSPEAALDALSLRATTDGTEAHR